MRLPDELLQTVFFVCVEDLDGSVHFGGTGFFVSVGLTENPDRRVVYSITARHVIDRASQYPRMFIRLNNRTGGTIEANMNSSVWHFPDNPAVDVAVASWGPSTDVVDYTTVPEEMFATSEVVKEHGIGIGDDLAVVGLFTRVTGTQRNRPIARMGHLAAMSDEPLIDDATGEPYRAYLAEIRSIGGLSGSPVFAMLEPGRVVGFQRVSGERKGFLLGMIRGHWDLTRHRVPMDFGDDDADKVNVGIATVTPVTDVLDIINSTEFATKRRAADRQLTAERAATLTNQARPEQGS